METMEKVFKAQQETTMSVTHEQETTMSFKHEQETCHFNVFSYGISQINGGSKGNKYMLLTRIASEHTSSFIII